MKNTITFAALLLSSTCALAAGPYMGVSAGTTDQKVAAEGEAVNLDSNSAKIYGGYQFASNVGIEGGYVHFGEIKETVEGFTLGAKPKAFYTAVTGTAALSPAFNLFGKLGVSSNQTKIFASFDGNSGSETKTKVSAMFAIGGQYKFNEQFSFVAEYENFGKVFDQDGLSLKVTTVSAGLRYTF